MQTADSGKIGYQVGGRTTLVQNSPEVAGSIPTRRFFSVRMPPHPTTNVTEDGHHNKATLGMCHKEHKEESQMNNRPGSRNLPDN